MLSPCGKALFSTWLDAIIYFNAGLLETYRLSVISLPSINHVVSCEQPVIDRNLLTDFNSSNSIDWRTPRGDLVKRAYWHCVIMETSGSTLFPD